MIPCREKRGSEDKFLAFGSDESCTLSAVIPSVDNERKRVRVPIVPRPLMLSEPPQIKNAAQGKNCRPRDQLPPLPLVHGLVRKRLRGDRPARSCAADVGFLWNI